MSEINQIKPTSQVTTETVRRVDARHPQQGSTASQHHSASDTVSLTDTAARLQVIEKRLSEESGVDKARVARIRAAIAEGSYQIQDAETAKNMMQLEQSLFGRSR